jgi:hypothetical protein
MNYTFSLTNTPQGQLFESKNMVQVQVHRETEGDVHLRGILHTIYSKKPFVLYNYLNSHLTSKRIDDNNFMLHFISGAPITPEMGVALYFLDTHMVTKFDIHYEPCVLDFKIPDNMCLRNQSGLVTL